jgi:hypothetical protein
MSVKVCIKGKADHKAGMYNSLIMEDLYDGELVCERHGRLSEALWIGKVGADFCIECLKEAIEQEVTR